MYFSQEEFAKAVKAYKKIQAEADKITSEVFSSDRLQPPKRSLTEEDIAIYYKRDAAWQKIIDIGRRPLN